MKITTIPDRINSGFVALPGFQYGCLWNREHVRGQMQFLCHHHPVDSLLIWVTEADKAHHRIDGERAPGVVKMLLADLQRITSPHGIEWGKAPPFFDDNDHLLDPLPPHSGQCRIVTNVDEVMVLGDELESQAGNKDLTSNRLLDAIPNRAFDS